MDYLFHSAPKIISEKRSNGRICYYVYFRYTWEGKNCVYRKTFGLGKVRSAVERKRKSTLYLRLVKECLEQGWKPWTPITTFSIVPQEAAQTARRDAVATAAPKQEAPTEHRANIWDVLAQGLEFSKMGHDRTGLRPKSIQDYLYRYSVFVGWLKKNRGDYQAIEDITPADIQLFMDYLALSKEQGGRGMCGTSRFAIKAFISTLFDCLQRRGVMPKNNLLEDIIAKKSESSKRSYTNQEKEAIFEWLLNNDPDLYDFAVMVHETGIRLKELCLLRISDIDLHNRELTVHSDIIKTKKGGKRTITKTLFPLLEKRIAGLPTHYYLFGKKLKPSAESTKTAVARKRFSTCLKHAIPYPIPNHGTYALKHTGLDAMSDDGLSLEEISRHFGHKNLKSTLAYDTRKGGFNKKIANYNSGI